MVELTKEDVPLILPDIINPAPSNEYYIGADYCEKENKGHFSIFNKTLDRFEYHTTLFTPSKGDYNKFCDIISAYFNAKLLKEI